MSNEEINNPEVQEIVRTEIHKEGATVEGIKKSVEDKAGVVITENEEILNLIKEYPNATAEELKIATNIVEETAKAVGVEEAKAGVAASMLLTVDQTPEPETGVESKESFPEGHILHPDTFKKIAQLEAIGEDGGFSQDRYDKFIADENNPAKSGERGVLKNQQRLQGILERDGEIDRFDYLESVIFGRGGWNRYGIDAEGRVFARRDVMTGPAEYKAKLEARALEYGFGVKDGPIG